MTFGVDAASYQGRLDWSAIDALTGFGWEKVTQGAGYVNPYWAWAKPVMAARARASGFIPGAYMFLEHGPDPAAQAAWFAAVAGNLDGWGLAIDIEPTATSQPTMGDARAAVAELRRRYRGHPVTGYIPHWYWGSADTTFVDVLWASNYVTRPPAGPRAMYAAVQPAQWASYGGRYVSLLQFTSRCRLPGAAGDIDCSAFRGSPAGLRELLAGGPAHPAQPPAPPAPPAPPDGDLQEDDMGSGYLPTGIAGYPLALPNGTARLRFFSIARVQLRVDFIGVAEPSADLAPTGYDKGPQGVAVPAGCHAVVVHRVAEGMTTADGTPGAGTGAEMVSWALMGGAA